MCITCTEPLPLHPEGRQMRALLFEKHGKPEDVLKMATAPVPSNVGVDEMLVRVHAAAFNPIDAARVAGKIKMLRPEVAWPAILGYDMAGVVEMVGSDVSEFSLGDAVAARPGGQVKFGTCAEYIIVQAKDVAKKPPAISFTDAASLGLAGQTAIQAFRRGGVKAGDKVLITGGAGGVGTLAIQIAKHCLGAAEVATTASPGEKSDLCKSLGADIVIDYHSEQFENILKDYDFALDTTGESHKMPQILKADKGKKVVTVNGIPTKEACDEVPTLKPGRFASLVLKLARNKKAEQAALNHGVEWSYMFLNPCGEDMLQLLRWVDEGKLKPVIDQIWSFEKAKDAALRNFSGRAKGKCVVQVLASEAGNENARADQITVSTDSPTAQESVEETKAS